jgi:integrase
MATKLNILSARAVKTIKQPGRHADGGNLYFKVDSDGSRRWVLFYRSQCKMKEMGLGGAKSVSLATAREIASKLREQLAAGIDPIEARNKARREAEAAEAAERGRLTFGKAAEDLIASKGAAWRNAKHRAQWQQTLSVLAADLTDRPVDAISTADILAVLKPIWTETPETAQRLRGRIESVLDFARCHGAMPLEAPNLARWKGHLEHMLPRASKLTRGHHSALPYADVPAFMVHLREQKGVGALALEFTILTAARSGEARGATWAEIDLDAGLWTIPASRMKGAREHRVPLSGRAVEVLREVRPLGGELVFPGLRGRPLSDMSLTAVLRRMGINVTVHGFRSSFRDWCGNETQVPREVAEAALAHALADKTEAAYRRSDALAKRAAFMAAWANYCTGAQEATPNVVPIRQVG